MKVQHDLALLPLWPHLPSPPLTHLTPAMPASWLGLEHARHACISEELCVVMPGNLCLPTAGHVAPCLVCFRPPRLPPHSVRQPLTTLVSHSSLLPPGFSFLHVTYYLPSFVEWNYLFVLLFVSLLERISFMKTGTLAVFPVPEM